MVRMNIFLALTFFGVGMKTDLNFSESPNTSDRYFLFKLMTSVTFFSFSPCKTKIKIFITSLPLLLDGILSRFYLCFLDFSLKAQ